MPLRQALGTSQGYLYVRVLFLQLWGWLKNHGLLWLGELMCKSQCFVSENSWSFSPNWVTGALGSFASWAVELRSFLKWTTSTLSAPLSRLNPFCKILQQQNQKCKSTNSTSIGLKMKQRNQIPAKGREAELQIIPLAAICRAQLAILSPAAAIDKRRMWMGQAHAILPLMLLWLQLLSAQELCAGSDFC